MKLEFSRFFAEGYRALDIRDVGAVDSMLDRLDAEHDRPHMRNVIAVASTKLYATPRFDTPSGNRRTTWQYSVDDPTSVIYCVTVAIADATKQP